MAASADTIILKNCYIEIDDVDLSAYATQAGVTMQKDDVDMTTFGSGTQHQAGLSKDQFDISFLQSFASAKVDPTLWPLYNDEEEFTVRVGLTSTPSETSPHYVGTCVLLSYPPFSGAVGARAEVAASFMVQGSIEKELS